MRECLVSTNSVKLSQWLKDKAIAEYFEATRTSYRFGDLEKNKKVGMMRRDTWDEIIAETSERPLPLSEERFRQWMGRQSMFVSSLMDDEMTPFRDAVCNYLRSKGATPIMWEEITPQDKGAHRAYLDGVDQSSSFVLMLGRRYGGC